MAETLYTIELSYYDSSLKTLYASSGRGFTSLPTDTPANTAYPPRVISPGNFERNAFASGTTGGASQVGRGVVILNNADGGLDALKGCGFGRSIVIRKGSTGTAYPAAWTTILSGTVEQAEFSQTRVTLRIRDRQAQVANLPFQSTKFAGNNSLPNGFEGVAADLLGKPKPRLYGVKVNFAPPQVNTSKLIYQISDIAIASIQGVYDRGNALTVGTAYATAALLAAATTTAGTFDYCLADAGGAFIKLGTAASGLLTVDATQGATSADRTVAAIVKAILKGPGGLVDGDLLLASFPALDVANAAECGEWFGEETTVGEALDKFVRSIGGYWGITRAGLFSVGRLELPSGSPVLALAKHNIIAWQRQATADPGNGQPIYRVALNYAPLGVVQDSDIAGAVTQARRSVLAQAAATVVATDASVPTKHPLAVQLTVGTLLAASGAATTEAGRLQTLYGSPRDMLAVRVASSVATGADIGSIVSLTLNRFDWSAGRNFVCLGLTEDYGNDKTTLILWG